MSSDGGDLDPNDNNAHLVYYPAAVFAGICPVLVALRTWSRMKRGGKMGADDWTAWAALVFCLLTSAFLIASCQFGMGRHFALIEKGDKYQTLKFFYLAQISYKASINLTKCCILLLYLNIFDQIRWFRWACRTSIIVVGAYCVASVIATIFQCSPISRTFDKSISGTCIDNSRFWYANAGFSISTDVVILLLPMPLVYGLQIPTNQKIALAGVFCLGIFVVITSCLRVTTLDLLATSPDVTYDIENVMWTIIEPNVAVICACLPMLRTFIVRVFPSLRSKGSSYAARTLGQQSGAAARSTGVGTGIRSSRAVVDVGGSMSSSQLGRSRNEWEEIGGSKSDAVQMTAIQRSGSTAGSEESILAGEGHDTKFGIQKTVDVTVHYSDRHQH